MSRTIRFTQNVGSDAPYSGAGIQGSPVRFFIVPRSRLAAPAEAPTYTYEYGTDSHARPPRHGRPPADAHRAARLRVARVRPARPRTAAGRREAPGDLPAGAPQHRARRTGLLVGEPAAAAGGHPTGLHARSGSRALPRR